MDIISREAKREVFDDIESKFWFKSGKNRLRGIACKDWDKLKIKHLEDK